MNGSMNSSHMRSKDIHVESIKPFEAAASPGSKTTSSNRLVRCRSCFGLSLLERCANAMPRVHGIIVGIILPLWFLIGISTFFGYGLSVLESEPEISVNDEQLRVRVLAEVLGRTGTTLARCSTLLCYTLLHTPDPTLESVLSSGETLRDSNAFDASKITAEEVEYASSVAEAVPNNCSFIPVLGSEAELVNYTQGVDFMTECGDRVWNISQRFIAYVTLRAAPSLQDLTFNWNRCDKTVPIRLEPAPSNLLSNEDFVFTESPDLNDTVSDSSPAAQVAHYRNAWSVNQEELFVLYLSTSDAVDDRSKILDAFNRSLIEATGKAACEPNVDAAVWFWFTVMSTMGYGNQAPITFEGRLLVIMAGFISILAFAGLLATSGYIVSAIFDDFLVRFRLRRLTSPWIASLFWLVLYFTWMLFIAGAYRDWKLDFLDETISGQDSYWFAFISTTTVGLGDFFLAPEVVTTRALITWPLLMLFGFLLFAAFAGKFTEAVGGIFQSGKGHTLVDRLKRTNKNWVEDEDGEAGIRAIVDKSFTTRKDNEPIIVEDSKSSEERVDEMVKDSDSPVNDDESRSNDSREENA